MAGRSTGRAAWPAPVVRGAVLAGAVALLLLARAVVAEPALRPALQPVLAPALFGATVVIDPGHGGPDPGMVGGSGTEEKSVNLAVAEALAEYCRSAGALVTLTREQDGALADSKRADLEARVGLAETAGADIFISLHCNSFVHDPAQQGAQVFYWADNEEGAALAAVLQAGLQERTGTNRTALPHPDSFLLKNLQLPAVIVELGFLSNPQEEARLNEPSYQWELAECLFAGLVGYLAAPESAADSSAPG